MQLKKNMASGILSEIVTGIINPAQHKINFFD
jgi:hypothetical protein